MKTRSNQPNIPFMSMKVDKFYKMPEINADQPNPGEQSAYSVFGRSGQLNFGMVTPVQDGNLLATETNLGTGNKSETTIPGYVIRRSHFEEIYGPNVMNHQNAFN